MNAETSLTDGSLARYLDEVARHPVLNRSDEVRLGRLASEGDEVAKRRLVESHLRLVVSIARRYQGLGLDLLDLIQEGNLGLLAAVDRYDWRRSVKFASYASWRVRGAIIRALSTKSRLIRLPIDLAEHAVAITRVEERLAHKLGRAPTHDEVAAEAGVDAALVKRLRRANRRFTSLSSPVAEGEYPTQEDLAGSDAELDPAAQLDVSDEQRRIAEALSTLSERSRRVLELRFGIDGGEPRTLADIAVELGVSSERVRVIESKALRSLSWHPELTWDRVAA